MNGLKLIAHRGNDKKKESNQCDDRIFHLFDNQLLLITIIIINDKEIS